MNVEGKVRLLIQLFRSNVGDNEHENEKLLDAWINKKTNEQGNTPLH